MLRTFADRAGVAPTLDALADAGLISRYGARNIQECLAEAFATVELSPTIFTKPFTWACIASGLGILSVALSVFALGQWRLGITTITAGIFGTVAIMMAWNHQDNDNDQDA